jgi:2-polyprenyl-3-methyl-5-hydroxy-6-metoxy-1,4-benzoquinol methylase
VDLFSVALSFLAELEAKPTRLDCPVLYRLGALSLTIFGDTKRAHDLYLPFFELAIRSTENRFAWYGYSIVAEAEDQASQSQRFGENEASLAKELDLITSTLEIDQNDHIADIGGAGGLFAGRLATLVHSVVLSDISKTLIDKASRQLENYPNIECVCNDITTGALARKFDKVLVASVTPCFASFAAFQSALSNIFSMLKKGGLAFISNNYDVQSAPNAAKNVLSPNRAIDAFSTLYVYENMLWLDIPETKRIARQIGFSECSIVNQRTLPDGRGMFDFLLVN